MPTDGSDHATKAVELAADMAAKYNARIVILHTLLRHNSASEIKALSDEFSIPEPVMEKLQELEDIQAISRVIWKIPVEMK